MHELVRWIVSLVAGRLRSRAAVERLPIGCPTADLIGNSLSADKPGLQVQSRLGEWVDVPASADSFFI
jgi:hypothetical protein